MAKILIQKTKDNRIFWGARTLNQGDEALLNGYPVSSISGPITFKEIEVADVVEEHDKYFCWKFNNNLSELDKILDRLGGYTTPHVMTVGMVFEKDMPHRTVSGTEVEEAVELLPEEEDLAKMEKRFALSFSYYYEQKCEWGLAKDDRVEVLFDSCSGSVVYCTILRVIASQQQQAEQDRLQQQRLIKDFAAMAGKVLLKTMLQEIRETNGTDGKKYTNYILRMHGIPLFPYAEANRLATDIIDDKKEQGAPYSAFVCALSPEMQQKKSLPYVLSLTRSADGLIRPRCPKIFPEYMQTKVVGIVESYASPKTDQLLWASFDDRTWSTCVFRNKIINGTTITALKVSNPNIGKYLRLNDNMEIWGPLVQKYLPLGFPATFHLECSEDTTKTRLYLTGFNPRGIEGRVATDAEAQDLTSRPLRSRVMVSPHNIYSKAMTSFYKLKSGDVMLTSEDYAGYAKNDCLPKALVNYCQKGVFSTEMKVPANVELLKRVVRFDVLGCLQDELSRLERSVGKREPMKICSIYLDKVYLTTEGGFPVEYTCRDEKEEQEMREQMFQKRDFTITSVEEDWVTVCAKEDLEVSVTAHDLVFGSLFYADPDRAEDEEERKVLGQQNDVGEQMIYYKGIPCKVITETIDEGEVVGQMPTTFMYVGVDMANKRLLAVAHHDRMIKYPRQLFDKALKQDKMTYVEAVCQILPELWLCRKNNYLLTMETTAMQSRLLTYLQKVYATDLPLLVLPIKQDDSIGMTPPCRWRGVGCGTNYSIFFSGSPIVLPIPLSKDTPRVLFFDVALTAPLAELEHAPMPSVILTGETTPDGAFVCRRAEAPAADDSKDTKAGKNAKAEPRLMGRVVKAEEYQVTFSINGEHVVMDNIEQLHIPIGNYAPLYDVFAEGTEWAVQVADNGEEAKVYQLDNNCPPYALVPYELVQRRTRGNFGGRGRSEWVVRSKDGQIALSELVRREKGDVLLMIKEVDDDSYSPTTYVTESDLLIGQNLAMRLKDIDTKRKVMLCEPATVLTMSESYEIPLEAWNWNSATLPLRNIDTLKNGAFMAKIISDDTRAALLDRRCLMPQYALMHGDKVCDGEYQMTVAGFNAKGYRLTQNNFTVTLQWQEASFALIPDDTTFRSEYLRQGTLHTVFLHRESDGTTSAQWRSRRNDLREKWMREAGDRRQWLAMMVHHIGTSHIFVEYDGAILYADTSRLGLWEGYDVGSDYKPGQIIDGCRLVWDEESDTFAVDIVSDDRQRQPKAPEVGSVHTARITRFLPEGDCYVRFGGENKWVAKVEHWNLTWEPYPEGELPCKVGDSVTVKIMEVDTQKMVIYASIKDSIPRPLTGPAAADAAEHPELRFFTFHQIVGESLIMLDNKGVKAELDAADSSRPLNDLKAEMEEKGGIWLPVIGVKEKGNSLLCSQKRIAEDYERMKQNDLCQKQKCVIRGITSARLVVSIGTVLGRIPRIEATGQVITSPAEMYKDQIGREIECVVTSFKDEHLRFEASIIKAHHGGLAALFEKAGIAVGKQMIVKVLSLDERGVLVQHLDSGFKGRIPVEELSYKYTIEAWGEKYDVGNELIKVECIDCDLEKGAILFSRKKCLIQGSE